MRFVRFFVAAAIVFAAGAVVWNRVVPAIPGGRSARRVIG